MRAADWQRLRVSRGHGECRAVFGGRRPRERAALLGCCTGAHAAALPLALSQAALGAEGLQLAALFCLFNSITGTPSSTSICLTEAFSPAAQAKPVSLAEISFICYPWARNGPMLRSVGGFLPFFRNGGRRLSRKIRAHGRRCLQVRLCPLQTTQILP